MANELIKDSSDELTIQKDTLKEVYFRVVPFVL